MITHLVRSASDHSPLFLDTVGGVPPLKKPFRFESFWLKDASCEVVVNDFWNVVSVGSPAFHLCMRNKNTKQGLREWNKTHFGCPQENIAWIRRSLELAQSKPMSDSICRVEKQLIVALNEELRKPLISRALVVYLRP